MNLNNTIKDLYNFFYRDILAYYDIEHDKIRGCKKGSWTYIHEQGHKKQRKFIMDTKSFAELALLFTIFMLVFEQFFYARLSFALYFGYLMILELDAYAYMYWVWKNKKGDKHDLHKRRLRKRK